MSHKILNWLRSSCKSIFNTSIQKWNGLSSSRPFITMTPLPSNESLQVNRPPKVQKKAPIFGITFAVVGLGLVVKKFQDWTGSPLLAEACCDGKIDEDLKDAQGHGPRHAQGQEKGHSQFGGQGDEDEDEEDVNRMTDDEKLHVEQEAERENWCECGEPEKPCCPYPDPPQCDTTCLDQIECIEECIAKANCDLEAVLMEIKCKAQAKTEETLNLLCRAKEISNEFIAKGYVAIGSDSPEAFCDAYAIAVTRCEVVTKALAASDCSWELLCRLRTEVESGKCCSYTHCNPLLITSEQFIECAERELVNARSAFDCVNACHETACRFCDLIKKFKAELQSEVPAECECDCGALMRVAYKKLLNMQKEVALHQVCQKEYVKPKDFEGQTGAQDEVKGDGTMDIKPAEEEKIEEDSAEVEESE